MLMIFYIARSLEIPEIPNQGHVKRQAGKPLVACGKTLAKGPQTWSIFLGQTLSLEIKTQTIFVIPIMVGRK